MNNLQTIVFKNRPYLFFLYIPFPFVFFISTAFILFGILQAESLLLFAVIFLVELYFLSRIFARFRYIPADSFNFNQEYFEYNGIKKHWTELRSMDIYYRGDSLWFSRFNFIQKYKADMRYNNLSYVAVKGYDEKMLDKIDFDSDPIYFKIRNQEEKDIFFKVKEFAESNNVKTTEKKTDFSYSIWGRTFGE